MKLSKKSLAPVGIAVGLCVISMGLPAVAQTRSNVRQGLPGRRISGGTRGECASNQPVIALDSANKESSASNYSSVDFLLPKFNEVYPVEFKLRDSQGNTVYTEAAQTGSAERLVSIQIPEKTLQASQSYHWYFSVLCDAQDRSQNIVLSGQLQQPASGLRDSQRETAIETTATVQAAR